MAHGHPNSDLEVHLPDGAPLGSAGVCIELLLRLHCFVPQTDHCPGVPKVRV